MRGRNVRCSPRLGGGRWFSSGDLEGRRGNRLRQTPNVQRPTPKENRSHPSALGVGNWDLGLGRLCPTCSPCRRPAFDRDFFNRPRRAVAFVNHVLRLAMDLVDQTARLAVALAGLGPPDKIAVHVEFVDLAVSIATEEELVGCR